MRVISLAATASIRRVRLRSGRPMIISTLSKRTATSSRTLSAAEKWFVPASTPQPTVPAVRLLTVNRCTTKLLRWWSGRFPYWETSMSSFCGCRAKSLFQPLPGISVIFRWPTMAASCYRSSLRSLTLRARIQTRYEMETNALFVRGSQMRLFSGTATAGRRSRVVRMIFARLFTSRALVACLTRANAWLQLQNGLRLHWSMMWRA